MASTLHLPVHTHYSILTRDEPRTLARVAELLDREHIDVEGIMIATVGAQTSIQFVAASNGVLGDKLRAHGLKPVETRIFEQQTLCRPKRLRALVRSCGTRKLRLLSLSQPSDGGKSRLILAEQAAACAGLTLRPGRSSPGRA